MHSNFIMGIYIKIIDFPHCSIPLICVLILCRIFGHCAFIDNKKKYLNDHIVFKAVSHLLATLKSSNSPLKMIIAFLIFDYLGLRSCYCYLLT